MCIKKVYVEALVALLVSLRRTTTIALIDKGDRVEGKSGRGNAVMHDEHTAAMAMIKIQIFSTYRVLFNGEKSCVVTVWRLLRSARQTLYLNLIFLLAAAALLILKYFFFTDIKFAKKKCKPEFLWSSKKSNLLTWKQFPVK